MEAKHDVSVITHMLTFPCTHTGAQWLICNGGYIMYVDEQLECESLRMTLLNIMKGQRGLDLHLDNMCGRLVIHRLR